jgi:germination protein M
MSFSASKHRAQLTLFVALGSFAVFLSACSHQPSVAPPPVVSSVPSPVPFDGHVTIYEVAEASQTSLADDNGLVPVNIMVNAEAKDPAREALEALANSKRSPLPSGTSILDIAINQSSGLATVNFSHQFKDNFPGGDTREAQVLNSVLATLGQFAVVQNVQFLVDGEKLDSLGGTQDLSSPLPAIKSGKETAVAAS